MHTMIVDASFLAAQSYHAARENLDAARQIVAQQLLRLAQHTDQALMAIDLGHTWRHEAYTDYKKGRAPKSLELRQLRSELRELGVGAGYKIYRAEQFEADDVIASLALRAQAAGWQVTVYSADIDLLQLCSAQCEVISPQRQMNLPQFIAKYGFSPERLPIYKAIAGDGSDNIPGVAQLGEKAATELAVRCANIEEVWARMDEHSPRVQKRLQEADQSQIQLFERLARLTPPPREAVIPVLAGELEAAHATWLSRNSSSDSVEP